VVSLIEMVPCLEEGMVAHTIRARCSYPISART
jgi:hypothetical protein